MSLQVWLPLTKDLRQQGLDSITVTTANTNNFQNEGKLSNKSLDVSGHYAFRVPSLVKKRVFSCAFWYKPITDSSLSDNWRRIIVFDTYTSDGSTTGAIFRFESSYGYQSSNTTYCISIHNNAGEPIASIGTGLGETDGWNKWQHIAITADGTTLKCYRNGVQVASGNMGNGGMLQGTVHIGYSGNRPIGRLNDFRLYDHCLSPMEVKELAKGLVLHYPLNRQGWGQDNLIITNSMTPTSGTSGWSSAGTGWANSNVTSSGASSGHAIRCTYSGTTQTSGGIHHPTGNTKGDLTDGAIYTVSARIRASKSCIATFHNELMTTGNSITLTTDWKIYNYSCAIDNSRTYHSNVIYVRAADAEQNMWIECDWIKLEEGSIATPWCPNSADTLYSTLGLDGTTEYDCSGYCNNGTRIGTFTWTSDTPKYAVSTEFIGSNYIVVPNSNYIIQGAQTMTWSVWGYDDDWTSYSGRLYSCTEGGGLNIEQSGSNLQWAVNIYTNAEQTSYAYATSSPVLYIQLANSTLSSGWHMFTWVYTTSDTKLYVDGELKVTKTGASYGIHFASCPLILGGEATSSGASSPWLTGKMSDFRIYATALSADDVKSLYQNSAYIDSSGNVYGAVHSEV